MRSNSLNFIIIGSVILTLSIGCGALTKGKPAAEHAVVEFHQLLNEEKFQQIYDEVDPAFKEAASFEKMNEIFEAVSRKLGKVTSSKNQSWKTNTLNGVSQVVLVQDTAFEHGNGIETFTFKIDGEKAALLGYYINSADLITK